MNLQKSIATLVLIALIATGVLFAVHRNKTTDQDTNKLQVTASFYPLFDFAKNVGGDKVQVTNITPAGAEPHDFAPSPKALADAQKAAVFIYNGGHLEPWTEGFLRDYASVAVQASNGMDLLEAADEEHGDEQVRDPHFWLDPVLAQQIVTNIRDGLSKADPANAEYYAKNTADYNAKLAQLDNDYKQGLAECRLRSLVSSHDAFSYLGKRYNLEISAIAGVSTEEEPSAAKLAELSQLVTNKGIKYIFFESLVSPRLADTIAAETGAQTLVFDPIEGLQHEDQQQGKNYLSVQQGNLANLRTALACK